MSGIWIRCQDKEKLLNAISMFIDEGCRICGYDMACKRISEYWVLGEYSSEDKAIKVLDMIQKQIENNWEFAPIDDRLGTQRLKVGVDKVFVMPQDSEVIVDET